MVNSSSTLGAAPFDWARISGCDSGDFVAAGCAGCGSSFWATGCEPCSEGRVRSIASAAMMITSSARAGTQSLAHGRVKIGRAAFSLPAAATAALTRASNHGEGS